MVRRTVSSTIFILSLVLMGGQAAQANTPLTRAVVSSLRNQVRLLPNRQPARKARVSDVLAPGDGIVTSRRSLAELRFNDGSLARMGEQAVFRFIPKTRSFRLSNGTVLMLIPPGQGRTQVRTPNVTAGIRGSALMIRYDKVTNTSTVIALTNSQISVTNRDQTQTQVLAAGQAVVTVGDEIVDSYDVDLQELYRTSKLLKDLEMNNPDAEVKDEAIAQVREETLEGIQSQRNFALGEGRDLTETFRLSELNVDSVIADETGRPFGTALPGVNSIVDPESARFPGRSIGVDGRFEKEDMPIALPVAQPAAVEQLPVTTITEAQPPVIEAITEAQSPVIEPSVVVSPVIEPPVVEPIFTESPVADNPVDTVPVIEEIASDVAAPDNTPISGLDSLPEAIPSDLVDGIGALELPEESVEEPTSFDDLSPPESEVLSIDAPVSDNLGDNLPGGDDIGGEVTVPDVVEPIAEIDSFPEAVPLPGEDTAALGPPVDFDEGFVADGGGQESEANTPEPTTVDLGVTFTVNILVGGEQQNVEQLEDNLFQTSAPTATPDVP